MSNEANTVRLHRVLRAPAERVYKAFIDKSALERWLPPYGFTGMIHTIDARVGVIRCLSPTSVQGAVIRLPQNLPNWW